MTELIRMESVRKHFGSGNTRVEAIRGIDLKIEKGEFIALLGKSGSGKSTFVSLLGGLEDATEGHVIFEGKDLKELSQDELARMRRKMVGIVFQHFNLMEMMTAVENTELPLLIANTPKADRRPDAIGALQRVELGHRITNYPSELSGGEKQRVGIARALVNRPSLILADEPTGDLDSTTGDKIIDLLIEINEDPDWAPTIVMVTHDITKLRKGMRVLMMSDGVIVRDTLYDGHNEHLFDRFGAPSEIKNKKEYDRRDLVP